MKYQIRLETSAHGRQTFDANDSGQARAIFSDCRANPFLVAAEVSAISLTGSAVTLETIGEFTRH